MKAVLDTNILVSSFFGGNPRKIIDLWIGGDLILCLSAVIVDEFVAVLRRLGLEGEPEFGELMDLLGRGHNILFAADPPKLKIVAADPDDDKFLECAVALKAEAVITGDKALKDVGCYVGIRIFSPAEFLRQRRK
jgi:putative PIN family toxin of toxin-antitoxin system